MDQVKSIITLRNGKVVEKHIPDTYEKDDESIFKNKEGVNEPSPNVEKTESMSMPPFPKALTQKKPNHNPEIFEIFKQVKVNLPLLDIIK